MTQLLMLAVLALAAFAPEAQVPSSAAPLPACEEGVRAANPSAYPMPPPKLEAPRLMIFVHGLQGNGKTSWTSGKGAYWPALVASDPTFKEFDIFVHEYKVMRPDGHVRFAEAVEEFVQVAHKSGLVSRYRDVVFVTEGDGVYFVRELLKRVRPFAARATMIFVAGRIDEVAGKIDKRPSLQIVEGKELLTWSDYVRVDAAGWSYVEPKPWIHCAVLGRQKPGIVERDAESSFCSTMPLSIPGSDWHALRPSCYAEPIYQAFRRTVGQYRPPTAQVKAAPATIVNAQTKPLTIPCEQTLERLIEVPLDLDPAAEVVLSAEATVAKSDNLKEAKAEVERIVGRVAIVRYVLTGPDLKPQPEGSGQPACATGQATFNVRVMKRPKG